MSSYRLEDPTWRWGKHEKCLYDQFGKLSTVNILDFDLLGDIPDFYRLANTRLWILLPCMLASQSCHIGISVHQKPHPAGPDTNRCRKPYVKLMPNNRHRSSNRVHDETATPILLKTAQSTPRSKLNSRITTVKLDRSQLRRIRRQSQAIRQNHKNKGPEMAPESTKSVPAQLTFCKNYSSKLRVRQLGLRNFLHLQA